MLIQTDLVIPENKISTVQPEFKEFNQTRSVKEETQLFRTQKIAGLAALSHQATQQYFDGELDAMDEDEEGCYLNVDKDSKAGSAVDHLL